MAIPKHDRTKPVTAADIRNPHIAQLLKSADEQPALRPDEEIVEENALHVQDAVIAIRILGEAFHSGPIGLWENGDLFVSGLPVHPRDVASALVARVNGRRFAYGKNGILPKPDDLEELKDHSSAVFDVYALNRLKLLALDELNELQRLYDLGSPKGSHLAKTKKD